MSGNFSRGFAAGFSSANGDTLTSVADFQAKIAAVPWDNHEQAITGPLLFQLFTSLGGVLTSSFSGNYSDLANKPTLFSGAYGDLSGKPTLFSGAYGDLSGRPSLSTVAESGSYGDLLGKPTLFSGAYADLSGKPSLAKVAGTGAYADLAGLPSGIDAGSQ